MQAKTHAAQVGQLRDDIAETRADLGETAEALAAKTDVKTRTANAARWAGASAGVLALAAAAVGVAMWQRGRRRQQPRAARAWQAVTNRLSR